MLIIQTPESVPLLSVFVQFTNCTSLIIIIIIALTLSSHKTCDVLTLWPEIGLQ